MKRHVVLLINLYIKIRSFLWQPKEFKDNPTPCTHSFMVTEGVHIIVNTHGVRI